MKVLLVAVNSQYIHSNLAVRYLKAYTKDIDYCCDIKEFTINDKEDRVVEDIVSNKPDIVAFSCYIWNISFIKKISTLLKIINPDIEILFGGPEVSYASREILNDLNGEYIIEGEGEATYREFINKKISNAKLNTIPGLYIKTTEGIEFGGRRELLSMDQIVFPYEDGDDLQNKIVYYEGSRGCPFNCKYCLSSTLHNVRFLDLERVKKELNYFVNKKVKLIKFVDRTFNCNAKFAIEIWEHLISLETDVCFHFEISADLLSKEQVKTLSKAPKGRFQFEVGVQTTNKEVLKNINRDVNFNDIKDKIIEIKQYKNIKQHLDLIAGLPGENLSSFINSFNDVYSLQPDEIQLGFLKLLKGTNMLKEAPKWGTKYSPYPPYEILSTSDISYEELNLLKKVEKMVDKYYNTGKFSLIIKYLIQYFRTPFDFYYNLSSYFEQKGYFKRNISVLEYYKVFLDLNWELLKNDNTFLIEIIKFEYLRYNKKSFMPEFLIRYNQKNKINKIKKVYSEKNPSLNMSRHHIEEFKVDVFNFINKGEVLLDTRYLIFNLDNELDITDITDTVGEI